MNQTAVDFLYEALWESGKDKFIWQIILQQAKEMEKEQIQEAYWLGTINWESQKNAEEYYKENYKNK
jgi:hypothetical protein